MTRRIFLLLLLLCLTPLQSADAARRKATLEVRSTPTGAQVTIDGEPRGITPLTVRGLAPGAHEVTLTKEGFVTVQREVNLRSGKRKVLKVRLGELEPIDQTEKDRRRSAASEVTPPLEQVGVLCRMFLSSSGFTDVGDPASVAGEATFDPVSSMWVVTAVDLDDLGNLVISADYFLDEAVTQPAGGFVIVADGPGATATYAFTAGDLAGQTGTLVATVIDLEHIEVQAAGEMPEGWSYTGDFDVTLSEIGFTLHGIVTLTDPDGGTTEWLTQMTLDGATFVGEVGGIQVHAHFNADGSGEATLSAPKTGDILAELFWDVEGTATITYPDGSTETFELF